MVFLYNHNSQELLLNESILPFFLGIIFTISVTSLAILACRNVSKGEIISSAFILIFCLYGYACDVIGTLSTLELKHRFFVPMTLLAFYFFAGFIYNMKQLDRLKVLASTLNLVFSVLLLFNFIQLVPKELKKAQAFTSETESQNDSSRASLKGKPDIYFIILDEYASSKTIKNFWGYDNSPIESFLISKGFAVAEKAITDSILRPKPFQAI